MAKGVFDGMLNNQGGVCAICGGVGKGSSNRAVGLVVDHDHETGRIRGLLCSDCNTALGRFGDSRERLMKAVRYLEGSSA
jgi:hypothetical protein